MANNFEKFAHPYDLDKSKIDLRSYALKASDYIRALSEEAGAEQDRFVQNSISIVRAFSQDHSLIDRQVRMIEQRLWKRIEQRRRCNNSLPNEVFNGGVINIGKVVGSNIDARLKIEHFSGNMTIYGTYGMGKTNLNLTIIPQLTTQGMHVDIFDMAIDFRDLLQVPGCEGGLVLNHDNDRFNPLEPIGSPEDHLQFLWEITQQDFSIRDETKEMLFNYSNELYEKLDVYNGGAPPSLNDLKEFILGKMGKSSTTAADKKKIQTALRKIDYIRSSFKGMADCRKGYSLELLDKFSFVSYEVGNLSEDKRSWYMKFKARQYQYKGLSSKERHKTKRIIVVDEAKGIFGKSRIGMGTNFIKDMFTKSRSIGCSWIISDQFATELADFTRAASCLISFQHTVPRDIREISVAMGCTEEERRTIPRLGRYKALQKIAEYPSPYQIATYKSGVERHIGDAELERLMKEKIAGLNSQSAGKRESKKVRLITKRKFEEDNAKVIARKITKVNASEDTNPLEDIERFLKYINANPGTKLTSIYKALGLSGRKGGILKNKAVDNELAVEEVKHAGRKGRPTKELKLTEKGMEYLHEK
ncbi:MAG: hypothetical protein V3W31_08925 [Thermodesulfobacteriota bacterium]